MRDRRGPSCQSSGHVCMLAPLSRYPIFSALSATVAIYINERLRIFWLPVSGVSSGIMIKPLAG